MIKVDTSITIELEQEGETIVLVLTVEEARALKDELIRAVGARPDPPRGPLAPVINITPSKNSGFLNTDAIATKRVSPADHVMANGQKIPEHLLKRAEAARQKAAAPDVRGNGVLHPNDRPQCHCGSTGWGTNGCCGVSGCNNVPA